MQICFAFHIVAFETLLPFYNNKNIIIIVSVVDIISRTRCIFADSYVMKRMVDVTSEFYPLTILPMV